ncbi:divergent polysaccharide deacetylase family protein [Parvibaculum sp.]|uniref:divergent polysaccharide deacetylase family protein n=1 Tax=Parvibaculum sp. TaxID=2024848 RepID=UPI002C193B0D|nr:divergent polysaccharide deacetylase family protein [Parvibaculum sp.]HUD51766.1 divergent polysaccharide deacetylase family protein [Parvibaculum sp.]
MPHRKALKHIRKLWAQAQFRRDLAVGGLSVALAVGLALYWRAGHQPAPPPPAGPQVPIEGHEAPPPLPPRAEVPAPVKPAPVEQPAWKRNAVVLATPPRAPMIAIVLDDMGPNRKGTERALDLPASITFSFLPYAPKVADFVKAARERGHEIIVHVPMEPVGHADPGPHALRTGETDQQLNADLVWNLSQFDGYVGINNHMGSRFTADAKGMALVMKTLKARGLMFLDSRTTAQTEAANAARAAGLPTLSRDVFLDNDEEGTEVTAELGRVEEIARKHGAAIAIGHPHAVTLDMLEKWIPQARARGFTLVPLTAILKYHEAT